MATLDALLCIVVVVMALVVVVRHLWRSGQDDTSCNTGCESACASSASTSSGNVVLGESLQRGLTRAREASPSA